MSFAGISELLNKFLNITPREKKCDGSCMSEDESEAVCLREILSHLNNDENKMDYDCELKTEATRLKSLLQMDYYPFFCGDSDCDKSCMTLDEIESIHIKQILSKPVPKCKCL
jgi:hypothetical protein